MMQCKRSFLTIGLWLTLAVAAIAAGGDPVARDDSYTILKNSSLFLEAPGVMANDSDPDGDPLTTGLVTGPSSGTLVFGGMGRFTYTPNAGFIGTDEFRYRVSDGSNWSNVAAVSLRVTDAGNHRPVGNPEGYATPMNTPIVVPPPGVLANDSDPDSDTLMARLQTLPSNGTLAFAFDRSFTYTPNAGFVGTDWFEYRAYDSWHSGPVLVTIQVGTANQPPAANDDQYTLLKDTMFALAAPGFLVNDTDADGDPLTAELVAGPTSGVLTLLENGMFAYTPNAGYSGTDSFTYRVCDVFNPGNVATVSLRVTDAGNHRPVGGLDVYDTSMNTPLVVPPPGVLANDSDPDGDVLMARLQTLPRNGRLFFNFDGTFRYVPYTGYVGCDSFFYEAYDGWHSALVLVVIQVDAQDQPPTATQDQYTLLRNSSFTLAAPGVLANDTDPEGDPLSAALATGPVNGVLALNANGSFTYTPNAGFEGADTFTYSATDGMHPTTATTVALRVTVAGNHRPLAAADGYYMHPGGVLQVPAPGVLANDTDADGDTLMARLATLPAHGALVFNWNGSFTYTPDPGYVGVDSFTYRAYEGLHSTAATVTINVTAGTITIDVTPNAGSWTLTGPAGFTTITGAGDRLGAAAITNAPPGAYILTCNDNVPDYDPPVPETRTLAAGGTISFTPVYTDAWGTITIDVAPDAGSWTLTGPAGFTTITGTGDRTGGAAITHAPVGAYVLTCDDNIPDYDPPAPQTRTLGAGGTIAFMPRYRPEGSPEEITIYLPGGVPLVLVRIPEGGFQMGSPDTERSRFSNEGPVHTVSIGYDFYMGKYEVTKEQWEALMGSWRYGFGNNNGPVNNVSWGGAQNFITALNTHIANTHQGPATFRLPSEAEWEYACRAGTQTRFFFGDSLSVGDREEDGPAGTLPGNRSDYMRLYVVDVPNSRRLGNDIGRDETAQPVWPP
jgi:hypothetical protein